MRAALTFSESNLLEFVEFAPPAAQLAAEIARSLEPVLGVLGKNWFLNFSFFLFLPFFFFFLFLFLFFNKKANSSRSTKHDEYLRCKNYWKVCLTECGEKLCGPSVQRPLTLKNRCLNTSVCKIVRSTQSLKKKDCNGMGAPKGFQSLREMRD